MYKSISYILCGNQNNTCVLNFVYLYNMGSIKIGTLEQYCIYDFSIFHK